MQISKDVSKEVINESYNTEIIVITIAVAALIAVGFYFNKKNKKAKNDADLQIDDKSKCKIKGFIEEVILDYYNEYRSNYLAVRYNIKELESETSYVFKTKRIGTLSNILNPSEVSFGEEYLKELIVKKYNVVIPVNDQLSFITEISRIEGKIKAVESLKAWLPEDDYSRLISELEEDLIYYKRKYTTTV